MAMFDFEALSDAEDGGGAATNPKGREDPLGPPPQPAAESAAAAAAAATAERRTRAPGAGGAVPGRRGDVEAEGLRPEELVLQCQEELAAADSVQGAGAAWAEARLGRLEEELRDLRALPDLRLRRTALRGLQLELHPDKLPVGQRRHAQKLFLLVQAEWQAVQVALAAAGAARGEAADRLPCKSQKGGGRPAGGGGGGAAPEAAAAAAGRNGPPPRERTRQNGSGAGPQPSGGVAHEEAARSCGRDDFGGVAADAAGWVALQIALGGSSDARGDGAGLVEVRAGPSWTVLDLKLELRRHGHLDLELHRLSFAGEDVPDGRTLRDLPASALLDIRVLRAGLAGRVQAHWRMLRHAPEELRSDREVVLAAVRQDWRALAYASGALQLDQELALMAVRQDGLALQHLHPAHRSDRRVVLEAVRQNWRAAQLASEELQGDREVLAIALAQDWDAFAHAPAAARADREVALAAARQDGAALAHAADGLRADKAFVLAAIWRNGAALRFVPPHLRSDEDVLAAVTDWG